MQEQSQMKKQFKERVQSRGQGECHSEEASLLLEARIISGTEFLETDFSRQIIIWVKFQ